MEEEASVSGYERWKERREMRDEIRNEFKRKFIDVKEPVRKKAIASRWNKAEEALIENVKKRVYERIKYRSPFKKANRATIQVNF